VPEGLVLNVRCSSTALTPAAVGSLLLVFPLLPCSRCFGRPPRSHVGEPQHAVLLPAPQHHSLGRRQLGTATARGQERNPSIKIGGAHLWPGTSGAARNCQQQGAEVGLGQHTRECCVACVGLSVAGTAGCVGGRAQGVGRRFCWGAWGRAQGVTRRFCWGVWGRAQGVGWLGGLACMFYV
jgi:hypothetical protein